MRYSLVLKSLDKFLSLVGGGTDPPRIHDTLSSSKMKNRKIISIIGIVAIQMISCKSVPMKMEDFSYKQEIRDSMLIVSNTVNPNKFIYGEFESILFKGEKKEFDKEIQNSIERSNGELYKNTYKEMAEIIDREFEEKDSVNMNEIKTTNLIVYPIYELAKSGRLYVIDKETNTIQDSIWEKEFYGENLYQDSIRARFYEGKIYVTKTGKEFLRVELKSGH